MSKTLQNQANQILKSIKEQKSFVPIKITNKNTDEICSFFKNEGLDSYWLGNKLFIANYVLEIGQFHSFVVAQTESPER